MGTLVFNTPEESIRNLFHLEECKKRFLECFNHNLQAGIVQELTDCKKLIGFR